jgi:hypothetical protein
MGKKGETCLAPAGVGKEGGGDVFDGVSGANNQKKEEMRP